MYLPPNFLSTILSIPFAVQSRIKLCLNIDERLSFNQVAVNSEEGFESNTFL